MTQGEGASVIQTDCFITLAAKAEAKGMSHVCQNNSVCYHRSCLSARIVQGQERGAGDAQGRHGAEQHHLLHPRSCSQRQWVTGGSWVAGRSPPEEVCALFFSAFLVLLSPAAPPQLGQC